jgi:hypothetical protein
MAELTFRPRPAAKGKPSSPERPSTPTFKGKRHWASDLQISLALGLDHGDLIGNSFGAQLTISKALSLKP